MQAFGRWTYSDEIPMTGTVTGMGKRRGMVPLIYCVPVTELMLKTAKKNVCGQPRGCLPNSDWSTDQTWLSLIKHCGL